LRSIQFDDNPRRVVDEGECAQLPRRKLKFLCKERAETASGIAIAPEGIQRCLGGVFCDRKVLRICNAIALLLC